MFPRLQFHITPSLKYLQDDQAILSRGLREVLHHLQDLASPIAGSSQSSSALQPSIFITKGRAQVRPFPPWFVIVRGFASRCEKPSTPEG